MCDVTLICAGCKRPSHWRFPDDLKRYRPIFPWTCRACSHDNEDDPGGDAAFLAAAEIDANTPIAAGVYALTDWPCTRILQAPESLT